MVFEYYHPTDINKIRDNNNKNQPYFISDDIISFKGKNIIVLEMKHKEERYFIIPGNIIQYNLRKERKGLFEVSLVEPIKDSSERWAFIKEMKSKGLEGRVYFWKHYW